MLREHTERKRHPQSETYYDIWDDWELIESSFLSQYGIRLRTEDIMSWEEFCSLLCGIMPETPLGRIVSIRSEKDPKIIKNFTKEQKRIRNEWILRRNRKMLENPKQYNDYWSKFQKWAKDTFSK